MKKSVKELPEKDMVALLGAFIKSILPQKDEELNLSKLKKTIYEAGNVKNFRTSVESWARISPSQFHDSFCLRRLMIARQMIEMKHKPIITANTKVDYPLFRRGDFGEGLHIMERKKYATNICHPNYKVYGKWVCTNCDQYIIGYKPTYPCNNQTMISVTNKGNKVMRNCNECGSWEYAECPVHSDKLQVSGMIDLLLEEGDGHFIIVDYKSKDEAYFKAIVEGKASPPYKNKIQLQIYMAALKDYFITNNIPYKSIRAVLDFENMSAPHQEYEISVPYSMQIEAQLLSVAEDIDKFTKNKSLLPPKRLVGCDYDNDKVAETCPFLAICNDLEKMKLTNIIGE